MLVAIPVAPKQDIYIESETANTSNIVFGNCLVSLIQYDNDSYSAQSQTIIVNSTISSSAGLYRFDNLIEGSYKVEYWISNTAYTIDFGLVGTKVIKLFSNVCTTNAEVSYSIVGGNTIVTLNNPGLGYKNSSPPVIITNDEFAATTTLHANGSISTINVLQSGNGTATSVTILNNIPIEYQVSYTEETYS